MENNESKLIQIQHHLDKISESLTNMSTKVSNIETHVYGGNGNVGMKTQLYIIWHSYIWVFCTMSAAVGWFANMWFNNK